MRAKRHEWRACANCFAGHPAFILGNGPTLPVDLSTVKDYFTVGVNRILYHFDPTVLMWFEASVLADIKAPLSKAAAVPFTNEILGGGYNALRVNGSPDKWDDTPLAWPDWIPCTGSSGASAAYWAMSLGCSPIYLLGMGAEYVGDRSSSYGTNRYHTDATMPNLQRALAELLRYANVYPILDQAQLERVTQALKHKAEGREYYLSTFAACHERAVATKPEPVGAKPLSIELARLGQIVSEANDMAKPALVSPRGKLHVKPCDLEDRQTGIRWEAIGEQLKKHGIEPKRGAEVGVWEARTSKHLLRMLPDLTMYMVDPWPDDWPKDGVYYQSCDATARMEPSYIRTRYKAAMQATLFAGPRCIVLRGVSIEMAKAVPDGTLDFVFIDACHAKECVLEDVLAWWPKVREGGLCCGHDWEHPDFPTFGVREAIEEFVEGLGRDVSVELGADLTWFIVKGE